MNHYPHHIGDFVKDTLGFSQGAIGAYRLLLDAYYANEEAIDAESVYVIGRATTPAERKNVDKALTKFILCDGKFYHKRVEEELAAFRKRSGVGAENAEKRWQKDAKADANPMPKAMPTECETDAKSHAVGMLASSHKPVKPKTSPERVSPGDSGTALEQAPAARAASPPEFPPMDDERVAALHALCLASGVQVRILHARQWVADGVSEVQMRAAIERGKQRKPGQQLNAGFLSLMIQDVRSEPAAYDAEAVAAEAIALIAKREAEREAEHVAH